MPDSRSETVKKKKIDVEMCKRIESGFMTEMIRIPLCVFSLNHMEFPSMEDVECIEYRHCRAVEKDKKTGKYIVTERKESFQVSMLYSLVIMKPYR